MKKTLTINLNGTVFNIDEDAFQSLRQYLEDLGGHFAADEKDEILRDIEARIAELFSERLVNRDVVEIEDVTAVIDTLGHPEQFEDDSVGGSSADDAAARKERREQQRKHRKFYRDGNDKRLGGVASGVAAFFHLDPTLVRLLFVVALIFSFGWATLVYLVLWLVVPEARTVAQRLEMQGIAPNVENIRSHSQSEEQPRSTSNAEPFVVILKILVFLLLAPIGLGLLAAAMGCIIAFSVCAFHVIPEISCGTNEVLMLASVLMLILCPAIALVLLCVKLLSRRPRSFRWGWLTLAVLWLLSLVCGVCAAVKSFSDKDYQHWEESFESLRNRYGNSAFGTPETIALPSGFNAIVVEDAIDVVLSQGDSTEVSFQRTPWASGVVHELRDSTLFLSRKHGIRNRGKVRVSVVAPGIERIEMRDASDLECAGAFHFKNLQLKAFNASDIELAGTADSLFLTARNASDVSLEKLAAGYAEISATGASEVETGNIGKVVWTLRPGERQDD